MLPSLNVILHNEEVETLAFAPLPVLIDLRLRWLRLKVRKQDDGLLGSFGLNERANMVENRCFDLHTPLNHNVVERAIAELHLAWKLLEHQVILERML